jgi:hypothetical protein
MYDHNLDDYAWYEVGQQKYYDKVEALFAHVSQKKPIRWNVNDDILDLYDWTVEPAKDLQTLYAERAQQIRICYDYLVLHFSGGSDSAQIIETFINNNIHLDEVLIRGSISQSPNKTGVVQAHEQYSECLNQALPLANWIKEHCMPHLKITVVDTVPLINEYYANNKNWIEKSIGALTPGNIVKSNLDNLAPHYKQLADQGKKVAHIFGVEKPKIFCRDNYFYTRYLDKRFIEWTCIRNDGSNYPQYIELFYWGKHAVELQIKQLHVVKNYIKYNSVAKRLFDTSIGRAYDNFIGSIVYKRTLPLLIEHLKCVDSSIADDRDYWFFSDQHNNSFKNWNNGVDYIKTLIPTSWHHSDGFWKGGIQNMWSKPRYLGT